MKGEQEPRALLYFCSRYIVDFITVHPINWCPGCKELAKLHGAGDLAGMPPTPAVYEFLKLLSQRHDLFSQEEFRTYCFQQWEEWLQDKTLIQRRGLGAKLYRNFYPTLIDSLHAWALLTESGRFLRCYLDSNHDAVGKVDITVENRYGKVFHLDLKSPGSKTEMYSQYKQKYRHTGEEVHSLTITLPWERKKTPGNKRWYCLEDFHQLFRQEETITTIEQQTKQQLYVRDFGNPQHLYKTEGSQMSQN